jgi:hypothetical protein
MLLVNDDTVLFIPQETFGWLQLELELEIIIHYGVICINYVVQS